MKMVNFNRLALALGFLGLTSLSFAAVSAPSDGYKYPELLVVPRASQTLSKKAAEESKSPYTTHLLLQAPAALTLFAGVSAMAMKEDKSKEAGLVATGVGAGWLTLTLLMNAAYTPYKSGLQDVSALGNKTPEQALASERRAEEALYYPAYIMRRLQYISAITNFGAGVAVASLEEKNDSAKLMGSMAAAAALLPLIFSHPWIETYDQQQEYKKRIYGPLSQLTLLPDIKTGRLVPGVNFQISF